MLKKLWENKLIILFIILGVWLMPNALSLPQQNRTETIVTAAGIDKIGDEFEVTLQYIIPFMSSTEQCLNTASEKGSSVGEAISKINLRFSKHSSFGTCKVIIFNEEASNENLTSALDFFLRTKTNTHGIILMCTQESAKDILNATMDLDYNLYTLINASGFLNDIKAYQHLKNLGDYYDCHLSPTKCIYINIIDLSDSEEEGSDQAASQGGSDQGSGTSLNSSGENISDENSDQGSDSTQGGGSSSSGGQKPSGQKVVSNKGKLLIIKDGKKLLALDEEQGENLNWFNPNIYNTTFQIKNFSDENVEEANIIFEVYRKHLKRKVDFIDNKFVYKVYMKLFVRTEEIVAEKFKLRDFKGPEQKYTKKVEEEMKRVIIEKMKSAEQHFKENEYDVVDTYNLFYKFKTKQFKEYLKSLPPEKCFLDDIKFEYEIDIVQRT